MRANTEPNHVPLKIGKGTTKVEVEPGQFIYGRHKSSKVLRMPAETIRTRLNKLKKINMLTIKSTKQYSIISIVNWNTYQPDKNKLHQVEHQPNTTDKNNKKLEELCAKRFDAFWKEYPKRENKQRAIKAFQKINPDEQLFITILSALHQQKQSHQWKKQKGQFIPQPSTWLNDKRWEDELTPIHESKFAL